MFESPMASPRPYKREPLDQANCGQKASKGAGCGPVIIGGGQKFIGTLNIKGGFRPVLFQEQVSRSPYVDVGRQQTPLQFIQHHYGFR